MGADVLLRQVAEPAVPASARRHMAASRSRGRGARTGTSHRFRQAAAFVRNPIPGMSDSRARISASAQAVENPQGGLQFLCADAGERVVQPEAVAALGCRITLAMPDQMPRSRRPSTV